MKRTIILMVACSSVCFGASIRLKNSSDCPMTAYLQDSITLEVFSVPVMNPKGGIADVDLNGTEGPYTIEWLQQASFSSDKKTCWGAGTFTKKRTALDSKDFYLKGCCRLSGTGKPVKSTGCGQSKENVPCEATK